MKKTIYTIGIAAAVAVGGGLLFGLDPVESFKFIVAMFAV